MKKYPIIIAILLPLILLSGCFLKQKNQQENIIAPAEKYSSYTSANLSGLTFSARFPNDWKISEDSTGKFGDFKDKITFIGDNEKIIVRIASAIDRNGLLNFYNINLQSQTQVDGILGDKYSGTLKENTEERFEAVISESGDYLLLIQTNNAGSSDFIEFLNNFAFTKLETAVKAESPVFKPKKDKITVNLYFARSDFGTVTCEANLAKKVIIDYPDNDLALIPEVMRLLLQLSQPGELPDTNVASAIPVNTRILSFGYEDNKVIVNFSSYLNEGGGSCMMQARRSQIEKTLKALNDVSSLKIKSVEIQVDGESVSALQP